MTDNDDTTGWMFASFAIFFMMLVFCPLSALVFANQWIGGLVAIVGIVLFSYCFYRALWGKDAKW